MIVFIVAISPSGVMGNDGGIPWYIPEDFKHFKKTTSGKTILMGAATWDSLPVKPLPNRRNLVVSRTRSESEGEWFPSIAAAIRAAGDDDIYVIGGSNIFEQMMPIADQLIISHVKKDVYGDTKLVFNYGDWCITKVEPHDDFSIVWYSRG